MRAEEKVEKKEKFAAEVVDVKPLPEEGIGKLSTPKESIFTNDNTAHK